jgi:sterol 3beta-glucosyltransferase
MTDRDPAALTQLCIEALKVTGQRGILLSGWGGLGAAQLPPSIYLLDHAPHEWLFPKMAAIVHHGGAGTTAASLRAGVPTVIIPFIADQPFFGEQVRRLGVGPAPIPRRQLTLPALTEAIRQATSNATMRDRAAALGDALQAEQGVANAVQLIERYSVRWQAARQTASAAD